MALTLRDSMAPALQLRDQPSIVDQGLAFEQYQADDSNPVLRGWRSAGLGSEANSLFSEANAAERRGDMLAAQAYEQQAQDSLRRSQVWAPTTQEFTKIDGLRSAGSWLGGQIGNLRTSVPPLVGGLGGGLGGAALGGLVAGPGGAALGGRIGAGLGAGAMGYNMEYDEAVGNAMMDPQIRATRSADDIHNASMVKGGVAGALESVVPAGVAKAAVLGVGKKVVAESLKKGMAKAAAIDAAQEAMTEAAQELTGQSTQNYLRGEDLTNWDAEQAFNAAMGGAVGGAVMGAGGQAAGTARDYLANREPKEKRDLLGRGIDAFIKHSEKKGREEAQREIAGMDDEAVLNKLFGKRTPHITDPISDEESKLSDEEIGKSRRALAEQHALEVVKAPAGMYPAEEVQAANEFLTGQAKDWMKMRDVSRTSRADKKAQDDAAALMKAAGLKEEKDSLMSPTLTDDFGEQEGRSMDDDTVTDDQGNVVRRANTRDMALPNDERGFGSTLRRVTSLQKSWDKQATEEQAKRTVTLADVLVNGGYWPKDIVDAAKTATQKEAQLTSAATLLTWLKYGMMRERKVKGGDTENVIEHLVGRYGKSGVDMLNKAYEVGVNAGLFDRNDEMFAERRVEAEKLLADEKNLGDLIMANLSPELKREVRTKEDIAYLVRTVRRMAGTVGAQANPEHNAQLRDATDTASPSRVDQRVLEEMFPNAENRHKVLAAAYSPSNSAFGADSKASQPVKETDGTGRTAKSFEVDERSSMEAEEDEDDTAPSTTQKVEYLNRKKGHAYSKKDPEHRAQLAKDRKEAQADGYRVEEIGAVERALEVARRSKGEALSEQEKFSVIEKEVKKHTRKGLDRPTEPPANASDVAKRLYADEMKRYKQRVQRAARGVDNRFVYLKRTETTDAPMSTELDLEAILSNERDVKIDDPRNGIGNGTMWFKKKTGGTFIINAPQITRLMFQRTENDGGLNHTVGTGEEKRELTKGGPQNVLELFHEGVASILAHDLFTGEFGYVHGGKAVEVSGNAKFPAEFKLSKSVTYGQGVASQKSFADQIEGNEFDQETIREGLVPSGFSAQEKLDSLREHAEKMLVETAKDSETRANLLAFVESFEKNSKKLLLETAAGKNKLAEIVKEGEWLSPNSSEFEKAKHNEKVKNLEKQLFWSSPNGKLSRRNHYLNLKKWYDFYFPNDNGIQRKEQFGPGVEKSRAKDGLQAYDPEKAIVRGKNGMAETGDNIEMAAASLIGRSKRGTGPVAERKVGEKIVDTPIVERVEDQGGVPTAKTPDRAEDGVAATQREAARQKVAEMLIIGTKTLRDSLQSMSELEAETLRFALRDFYKMMSDLSDDVKEFPHVIAKQYFQGDVNKARLFTSRLKLPKVSSIITSLIDKAAGGGRGRPGSKTHQEAFGEGRQADAGRTEARVAAMDNGQRGVKEGQVGASGQGQQTDLVTKAKPPAFAAEKEHAKVKGADFVFAPLDVAGSYASRLAEAAKSAGKLVDPNGTENIRDKVIYVSVPGASRGFTGMEAFIADVQKLLDRGAIIRTDTNAHASREHNAPGEGKLRQALVFANLNLTEGKLFDSWQKNLPRVKSTEQISAGEKPKARLLEKLGTIKPKNAIHKRAIDNLVALLKGGKQGDIKKAIYDMTRWDQTLGDLSPRQRDQLKTWVEKRGELNNSANEDVPIEAYDDETVMSWEESDLELDRAAFEGDTKYSLMSTEIHNDLGKSGFAATHDSPIRHEGKFNWREHSGKGEGNASFGAGTYLSTANSVHRSYKGQFTAVTQGGAFVHDVSTNQDVRDYLLDLTIELRKDGALNGKDVKEAVLDGLREQMREYSEGSSEKEAYADAYFRAKDMVPGDFALGSGGVSPTYHVSVNIKQDELLDWDKRLSSQLDLPKAIKDVVAKAFVNDAYQKALREGEDTVRMGDYTVRVHTGKIVGIGHEYGDFLTKDDPDFDDVVSKAALYEMTGEDLYKALSEELGSQAKASDRLQSLGILGHVYDAAGGEEDTFRNYVIYDDSKIETNYVHFSKKAAKGKVSTPEEQAAVAEQLHKLLGKDVRILFENLGGKSGSWTREQTMNVIRIAINADITSTGFHESMHQLLYLLKQGKGDGAKVVEQLQRAAMSPIMQQRLRTMLKDHPKAMSQLADPEEAISYMFQFWMMDQSGFKIGPETRTLFEHVKDFLRSVAALFSKTIRTQLLTEQASRIEAKTTLRVLNDLAAGKMADPTQRPSAIKVMAEYTGKRDEAVKNLGEGYKQLLQGFGKYLATNEGLLESYNNRHLTRLARLFNQRAGEAKREGASFFDERDFRINKMMNKWEKVAQKYSKEDLEIARAWMSTEQGQAHPDAGINAIVTDVKGILNEMKAYIAERDIKRLEPNPVTGKMEWKSIDFRKHYWPRIWDAELVNANKEEILEKLLAYTEVENIAKAATKEALKQGKPEVTKEDVALQIFSRMLGGTSQVELSEELSDLGMTPVATAVNRRSLEWLNMREFDKYVSKDMNNIMSAYIRNIIKRGEYQHRFGPGGEFLKELVDSAILTELGGEKLLDLAVSSLEMAQKNWGQAKAAAEQAGKKFDKEYPTTRSVGLAIYRGQHGDKAAEKIDATMKRLEPAFQAIMALEGTLGSDIDPTLRNVSSWVTTYQNYRLLVPGIFSSFMDVMGVVREGGELSDAWGAFVAGIKEIRNTWTNENGRDYMMERAELFGSADAGSYASTIGEANGSVYMSEGARKWSDRLFKWNGMEGWNRGMRAYATSVAERILLDWQKNGIDTKDKAAVARVERLFGKGFDVKNIAVEADGTLDIKDARNIAAVNRWVLDAVIRPNAAHRPVMASDPHMQVFYHLKNFTYSMHAVMLKNVAAQARLGNYRPAMVTLVGYAPIAIAAGAVKELLIPGDEPPWLKNGLVGYLGYGWDRAGVLGIPQMYASNLFDPAQNFGPSAGQLQDLITVPFGEFQVGPAGWRDHRVFEEMLGAAPFGTVLKRIGKNVDDIIEGK